MILSFNSSERIRTWRRWSLGLGLVGATACAWGFFEWGDRSHFFRAYLFAWIALLDITLGSMSLVMLHNLTGGDWGKTLRGVSQRAVLMLPFMVVSFIPLLFGMRDLYLWATPENVAANATLQHRAPYLNPLFFMIRAAACFAIWCALVWVLKSWQSRWEQTGDPHIRSRIRGLSAAGLIIYLLTMTHAGIDWIMSRDVEFYSTAFGFVVTVGQTLSATALAIIVLAAMPAGGKRQSLLAGTTRRGVLNDVGNILLTLVILWTYVSFMEFLVIWMGNSREDNTWFLQRGMGQPDPWRWVGLGLIVCHFFIPFFVLLFRATKQYVPALVVVACLLLVSHIVDDYWMVAASGAQAAPRFDVHWLDAAALAALGGLWLTCFLWLLPGDWPLEMLPAEALPTQSGR